MLRFTVNGQTLTRVDKFNPATDSEGFLQAQFEFSSDWAGMAKTAIFRDDITGKAYNVLVDSIGLCKVPTEVLAAVASARRNYFMVTVYGVSSSVPRATTNELRVDLKLSGFGEASSPADPTPSEYEQILAAYASQQSACETLIEGKLDSRTFAMLAPAILAGEQSITLNVGDLEIVTTDKYIDYSCQYQDLEGCNVYRFDFNKWMERVTFTVGSSYIRGLVLTEDHANYKRLDAITDNLLTMHDGYMLINHTPADPSKGIQTITVKLLPEPYAGTKEGNGRIQADGTFETFSVNATCYQLYIDSTKAYYYREYDPALLPGMAYDKDLNLLGQITIDDADRLIFPAGTSRIRLNRVAGATLEIVDKTYTFRTAVNKPFTFTGEEADCFGDSITAGYTNSSNITANGWVTLIRDKLGLNKTYNKGEGGHCLTNVVSTTNNMLALFRGQSPASKYIFIAIGTNDYAQQAPIGDWDSTDEGTMYGALNALFADIASRFADREIIVILPINRADNTPTLPCNSLDDYRQTIYDKCIANGVSVINGADFVFPSDNTDELAGVLFGDNLHPSEAGYKYYAAGVCAALT